MHIGMLTAIWLLAAQHDCPVPAQRIAIAVRPLGAEKLGAKVDAAAPRQYRVGSFVYEGNGIEVSSLDPRFRELVRDPVLGIRHRCGNAGTGPSAWNARDKELSQWPLQVEATMASSKPPPGALAAAVRGAKPVLRNYRAGATWPVHTKQGSFFLGLMYPETRSAETLIVAFGDAPQPTPALVVAKLPMRLDAISLMPDMHRPVSYVSLAGFDGGTWTQIALMADRSALQAMQAHLTPGPAITK